jgi:hypothetical protein
MAKISFLWFITQVNKVSKKFLHEYLELALPNFLGAGNK